MVTKLSRAFSSDVAGRLATLPPEAEPKWGRMRGRDLVPHLLAVFDFSLGRGPVVPFQGNFKSKTVMRWALLSGLAKIPRNVRFRGADGQRVDAPARPGTLDELRALMEEFISLCERGGVTTAIHPYLGDLGVAGWSRFHVAHIRHHLEQFGI